MTCSDILSVRKLHLGSQTDRTSTQRYPEFNITWDTDCQASACSQDLGISVGCLCASPVMGHLPFRVINTWRVSPLPSTLQDRQKRQHQVHRDNPSITLLQASHTRAPKIRVAICTRGKLVIQRSRNSLTGLQEVQAPDSDNRTN